MIIICEIVGKVWISFPFFSGTVDRPWSHIILMLHNFLRLHEIIFLSCVLIVRINISFIVETFRIEINKWRCFFISVRDYFEILIILVGKIDLPVAEENTDISSFYTFVVVFELFHQIKYISGLILLINIVHFRWIIYMNISRIVSASYILNIIFSFRSGFLLVPNYVLSYLLSALRHVIVFIEIGQFLEKSVGVIIIFVKWAHHVGFFRTMSWLCSNITYLILVIFLTAILFFVKIIITIIAFDLYWLNVFNVFERKKVFYLFLILILISIIRNIQFLFNLNAIHFFLARYLNVIRVIFKNGIEIIFKL